MDNTDNTNSDNDSVTDIDSTISENDYNSDNESIESDNDSIVLNNDSIILNNEYKSPISSKIINIINVFLSFILLIIKLVITYNFYKNKNNDNMFDILLMYILFYYSFTTLGWSNKRLNAINIIGTKLFDKFIENWNVIVADLFIVLVIFLTRINTKLIKQKKVLNIIVGLMCMRLIIQLYRIYIKVKNVQNTTNDNLNKTLTDNILFVISNII